MKIKETIKTTAAVLEEKFVSQFGFRPQDASFEKIVEYMHRPKDAASLAVTRILFGLCMIFDIPDERGGATMEKRWGDDTCHFPLFPFIQAISMPYMAIVYAALWLGAFGIMFGYKYRTSATVFTACYWYLFLIEKSYWNNHSYLFGIVALLLTCTEAGSYWSIDVYQDPSKLETEVPYWNYFILKYQFFILYFVAGLKKGTAEWLSGYSMENLSEHWVFAPFHLFLTTPRIDYFIVHWFIFAFDLTVAMWMMYSGSRGVATLFCALFHLMNSRLFRIGMFPWVCLATMPLFYPFDWPHFLLCKLDSYRIILKDFVCGIMNTLFTYKACQCKSRERVENKSNFEDEKGIEKEKTKSSEDNESKPGKSNDQAKDYVEEDDVFNNEENTEPTTTINENNEKGGKTIEINSRVLNGKKNRTLYFIIFHVITQAFLPYSHFITKGYNNWSNGLYGYSWDMMVHSWDTHAVIIKVVDNEKILEFYLDPEVHAPTDRWTRHSDMVYQYARCLKDKLIEKTKAMGKPNKLSQNISIYVDVWCSLNARFTQRHYDPNADMLKVDWSPFKRSSYLMPLLDEASNWREELQEIKNRVHSWSNKSDVVFLANFPGHEQEKYISEDLHNVTLSILEGDVVYEPLVTKLRDGYSYKLSTGENRHVHTGTFHKILNIGTKPALYMYTFYNTTKTHPKESLSTPKLPIFTELLNRLINMVVFVFIVLANLENIFTCFWNCK